MRCAKPVWLVILAIGWTASIDVNAEDTVVDLFEAVDRGDVDVRFIPLNAKRANVVITNQTNQPLQLRMPNAIAAVPVLGQFGQNQIRAAAHRKAWEVDSTGATDRDLVMDKTVLEWD